MAAYPPYKSPGTAALIAIIGGIFGFPGIGHIYLGKIAKGLVILFSGLILFVVALLVLFAGAFGGSAGIAAGTTIAIGLFIAYAVIWFWQIFNAHTLAKKYNEHIRVNGKEPW